MCKPKKEGGLWVKDFRLMNMDMLSKWIWRNIKDKPLLWKYKISSRYGAQVCGSPLKGRLVGLRKASY